VRQRFFARSRRRSKAGRPRWRWAKGRALLGFPSSHPRISPPNIPSRRPPIHKWSTILFGDCPQRRPGARVRFRALVAWLCKRSSAFCTGLPPAPRPPRPHGKTIHSSPKRKTQGSTPMITARLAVASDGSGRLLQHIKSRRHAGHSGVALAAPKKPRPNNA